MDGRDTSADDLTLLRQHARAILDAGADVAAFIAPTEALRKLVERCSGFDFTARTHAAGGPSQLPDGVALAPMQAARCARQVWRSAAFIQGSAAAVQAAQRQCSGRPVRVLYAGCGPFALLALPVMALWPASQVRFTLLDFHGEALASARRLVAHLGLEASVQDWVEADATAYRIDSAAPPDIIISETMSAALAHEPQVAITRHLLAQAPQAQMVPACVRVELALCDLRKENGYQPESHYDRIALGKVFTLDAAAVASWQGHPPGPLPAAAITLPAAIAPRYTLRLLTRIAVFADIALGDYACSLNAPRPLPGKLQVDGGDVLQFAYRLGNDPGLDVQLLSPTHST